MYVNILNECTSFFELSSSKAELLILLSQYLQITHFVKPGCVFLVVLSVKIYCVTDFQYFSFINKM